MRNVIEDGRGARVVRPEAVRLRPGNDAVVELVERRGAVTSVTVRTADGLQLEAATTALDPPKPGERVGVELDPAGVVRLPADAPGRSRA
jgi:hypothetical protein